MDPATRNMLRRNTASINEGVFFCKYFNDVIAGHEILRVRSEANMELRHRDEELTRKFQSAQDNQEAEFIRQKQNMVYEFNKATEALKDKISSLSIA